MALTWDKSYPLPPTVLNADGEARRVGFELEFSGLSLEDTVNTVCHALGGRAGRRTHAECEVRVDALGNFNVEIDWNFLKHRAGETSDSGLSDAWLQTLSHMAALLVPMEIVCPPIPVTDLDALDPLVEALRTAGAVGTEESLLAAYGVHINAEVPALDIEPIWRYLRAYALLQWWLVDAHGVDATRRASPYVDLYPQAFIKTVLSHRHATKGQLFDFYLQHNATRNRALDLLPLLAALDSERVYAEIDDPKINARPAFHYRLPDCRIERNDWSLARSWRIWCTVECLAERPDDMNRLAAEYLDAERPLLGVDRGAWVEHIGRWLKDRALA